MDSIIYSPWMVLIMTPLLRSQTMIIPSEQPTTSKFELTVDFESLLLLVVGSALQAKHVNEWVRWFLSTYTLGCCTLLMLLLASDRLDEDDEPAAAFELRLCMYILESCDRWAYKVLSVLMLMLTNFMLYRVRRDLEGQSGLLYPSNHQRYSCLISSTSRIGIRDS